MSGYFGDRSIWLMTQQQSNNRMFILLNCLQHFCPAFFFSFFVKHQHIHRISVCICISILIFISFVSIQFYEFVFSLRLVRMTMVCFTFTMEWIGLKEKRRIIMKRTIERKNKYLCECECVCVCSISAKKLNGKYNLFHFSMASDINNIYK